MGRASGLHIGAVHEWWWRIALVLFGVQLIGLLVFSTIEYQSFALGRAFVTHAQAWLAIAHGSLDPWGTLYGSSYWQGNGELLTWPLALLYYVYPHTVVLLWVQDLAVVVTEFVAFRWVLRDPRAAGELSHTEGDGPKSPRPSSWPWCRPERQGHVDRRDRVAALDPLQQVQGPMGSACAREPYLARSRAGRLRGE